MSSEIFALPPAGAFLGVLMDTARPQELVGEVGAGLVPV